MQFGVKAAIVRPFNIYGPGQESRFLVPKLIRQIIDPVCNGIAIGDPRPRRDYTYVSDLDHSADLNDGDGRRGDIQRRQRKIFRYRAAGRRTASPHRHRQTSQTKR